MTLHPQQIIDKAGPLDGVTLRYLGRATLEDIDAADNAVATGIFFSRPLRDTDLFLVVGLNGTSPFQAIVSGLEMVSDGAQTVGTALTAARAVNMTNAGGTAQGRLGYTAAGEFLFDTSSNSDVDVTLIIWEFVVTGKT